MNISATAAMGYTYTNIKGDYEKDLNISIFFVHVGNIRPT